MNPVMEGLGAPSSMGGPDCLGDYPAVEESRERLAKLAAAGASPRKLVPAIESDPSLTFRVLALANRRGRGRGVTSVPDALEVLNNGTIRALADSTPVL